MLFLINIFTNIKKNAILILSITLLTCILSFSVYFIYASNRIDNLKSDVTTHKNTITSQKSTIDKLIKDTEKVQKSYNTIIDGERAAFENYKKNNEKLNKLEDVVKDKPTLVEKKINSASKERIRCFALATGAPSLKNEKNSICQHLLRK